MRKVYNLENSWLFNQKRKNMQYSSPLGNPNQRPEHKSQFGTGCCTRKTEECDKAWLISLGRTFLTLNLRVPCSKIPNTDRHTGFRSPPGASRKKRTGHPYEDVHSSQSCGARFRTPSGHVTFSRGLYCLILSPNTSTWAKKHLTQIKRPISSQQFHINLGKINLVKIRKPKENIVPSLFLKRTLFLKGIHYKGPFFFFFFYLFFSFR